jgi:hypothetical protein
MASTVRTAFALIAFTIPVGALAGQLYVATTGNDSNDCRSPATACRTIQAAIDKAVDYDAINVAPGSYAAAIHIFERQNLTIAGSGGASIVDPGLPLGSTVIDIGLSRNITFQDLRIAGNPAGVEDVRIFDGLQINFNRCTIEQASNGFFINNHSSVSINDSTVQDNGSGVRVDGSSDVDLNSAPFSAGTSTVQHNGNGIWVRSGVFHLHGASVVEANGIGILGEGGTIKSCCETGDTRRISNNRVGIFSNGDNIDLRGPLAMEGNRAFAVRKFGGFMTVSDRVTMRNNGNAATAAVFVTGGQLQLNGVQPNDIEIADNPGIGVLVTGNASTRASNSLIRNNAGNGMRVQALSTAVLGDSVVMTGNGGFDLSCAPNSFAGGDDSGVGRAFCPGFDKQPSP